MSLRPRSRSATQPARTDWSEIGIAAAKAGDLVAAKAYLGRAVRESRQNAHQRFNLAIVHERLGEIEEAAQQLSEALRASPGFLEAARRLSMLLFRFRLADYGVLEPFGLRAAMGAPGIDRRPLAEAAFQRLRSGPIGKALEEARTSSFAEVAQRLAGRRPSDLLRDDLFLAALAAGPNRDVTIEPLLAALRSALLTLPAERFSDKPLQTFALALARQARAGEHVWHVTPGERASLESLQIDHAALLSGDVEAGRRLMLHMLYRPVEVLLPGVRAADCGAIRPNALRTLVVPAMVAAEEEARLAAGLAAAGTGPVDATSGRVAAQYEKAPYPRWESFTASSPGAIRVALQRYVPEESLAFFEAPFDVLIAGCGTGQQALQSAIGYGPNARVRAIDLSVGSLAYAARKAGELGIATVTFERSDILDLSAEDRTYRVIECVGVLHHLADPMAGWRLLADRLEPGGLMYVGLYSAISRRDIAALVSHPGYPGPDCSDEEARGFRHALMSGPESDLRTRLLASRDFYTLSEFRDLALHVSETTHALPEIESFLAEAGLVFRGFTIDPMAQAMFVERFPKEEWPGSLASWHALEQDQPRLFDGMYRFWCEKPA